MLDSVLCWVVLKFCCWELAVQHTLGTCRRCWKIWKLPGLADRAGQVHRQVRKDRLKCHFALMCVDTFDSVYPVLQVVKEVFLSFFASGVESNVIWFVVVWLDYSTCFGYSVALGFCWCFHVRIDQTPLVKDLVKDDHWSASKVVRESFAKKLCESNIFFRERLRQKGSAKGRRKFRER